MTTTLIGASAGTGKTYEICERVAAAIAKGFDPARLIATTFTKKAAGELKARLQARILSDQARTSEQRWAALERLELAAIGTVHAIAHRFLARYALELGLSPDLAVMEDGDDGSGQHRHLLRLLSANPPAAWSRFEDVAAALGIDRPQREILRLVSAKRANGMDDAAFTASMRNSEESWLAIIEADQPALAGDLDRSSVKPLAAEALAKLRRVTDETDITQKAIAKVRKLSAFGAATWADFAGCAKLDAGKRSGADKCLDDLRGLGGSVRRLASFRADVRSFMEAATETALQFERSYRAYKVERGLVDFVDLEVLFLDLARRPELSARLRADIELLIVDEFQDTNPLQLAIFQGLRGIARDTVWVGDRKQAIYGFRGTDAGLVDGVWSAIGGEPEQLTDNYRSQAGIVLAVNALFKPTFGADVVVQAKHAARVQAVERWLLDGKTIAARAQACANGVARLVAEGKHRPGEIAILVRTNRRASELADALDAIAVPCVVPLPGLLSTREGAAVHAGLRLAADDGDARAAAELLHLLDTDPAIATPPWLADRLEEVARRRAGVDQPCGFATNPVLAPLRAIPAASLTPADLVLAVQTALDLPGHLAAWGNPERRAANLDALVDFAGTYEAECRRDGSACTPGGLIRWFDDLVGDDHDEGTDVQPVPPGIDAVQILTYFKAKGLEWPAVICFDLDYERDPSLFEPIPTGGDPAGDPLAGRTLRYWPWPFGWNKFNKPNNHAGLLADAHASAIGQEACAAAAAESLRVLYVGMTRPQQRLILAQSPKDNAWLDMLDPAHVDKVLSPLVDGTAEGIEVSVESLMTSVVRRCLTAEGLPARAPPAGTANWIGDRPAAPKAYEPRWSSPSSAKGSGTIVEHVTLGQALVIARTDVAGDALGSAFHAYFAALPAIATCTPAIRERCATECLAAWGASGAFSSSDLVAAGERLWAWATKHYPGCAIATEVAIENPRTAGGSWRGSIDLLVLIAGKPVAIIDHKTVRGTTGSDEAAATAFAGQLAAYHEAISTGIHVDCWIHLPLAGRIIRVDHRSLSATSLMMARA